jgi:hypothetical protein
MKRLTILFATFANTAFASSTTIGPEGINSKTTGLDGAISGGAFGVGLGQLEDYRSGKAGYDDPEMSASNTVPGE